MKRRIENVTVSGKNIQADVILEVNAMGGEIIEKYAYYFDFSNKKMYKHDNSTIVPEQTKEEAEKNTNNTKDSITEYNLTQEQIDKAKEFIKQAKDKNEEQNTQIAVKAKIKVNGKEYAVNDYHSTLRDFLQSIVK